MWIDTKRNTNTWQYPKVFSWGLREKLKTFNCNTFGRILLVLLSGKMSTGEVWAQSSAPSKHQGSPAFVNSNYAVLDLLLVGFSGGWAEKIKPVQQKIVMHIHVLLCNNLMLLWWYTVTHFKNVIHYTGVRTGGGCAVFSDTARTQRWVLRKGLGGDVGVDRVWPTQRALSCRQLSCESSVKILMPH